MIEMSSTPSTSSALILANLKSAFEVKNNSCLFLRLPKTKKKGIFLFEISSFILEIFMFLYFANKESDDVIVIIFYFIGTLRSHLVYRVYIHTVNTF